MMVCLEESQMRDFQDPAFGAIEPAKLAIPLAANMCLAGVFVFLNAFQLFFLPLVLLPRSMRWSLVLIPLALLSNPFWALIHEAIHGQFSVTRGVNAALGRVLSVFFGSSFQVLRWSHLSHHKYNRTLTEQGTEVYDPQAVSRLSAILKYYLQIFGGLYLMEALTPLVLFLPRALLRQQRPAELGPDSGQREWLLRNLLADEIVQEIRIDCLAVLVIFGLALICYREHWRLLAALLMVRAFCISFLDNVYHYSAPMGARISGYNLRLPWIASKALLHFNLHGVHHRYQGLPWNHLPHVFAERRETYDYNYVNAALRQLGGPLPLSQVTAAPTVNTN
jgi:fatty acid desaturase